MALLKYTTQIDVEKTISEIQKMLSKRGAKSILTDYEDGMIVALSFKIALQGQDIGFRLPCDWRPVLELLKNDPKVPRRLCDQTQAVRVAWRIVAAWIEAQMALIDTKMVNTAEVFLPYAIMRDGRTLAQGMSKNPSLLLGSSKQ